MYTHQTYLVYLAHLVADKEALERQDAMNSVKTLK